MGTRKRTPGERIIAYREKHGLSRRQFAIRCGLNNVTILNIEAGNAAMLPETAKKIAAVTGWRWWTLL